MRSVNPARANEIYEQIQQLGSTILADGTGAELLEIVVDAPDAAALFIAAGFLRDQPAKLRSVYERLALSDLPHISTSASFILREGNASHRGQPN
jgi:hypothetical protein